MIFKGLVYYQSYVVFIVGGGKTNNAMQYIDNWDK